MWSRHRVNTRQQFNSIRLHHNIFFFLRACLFGSTASILSFIYSTKKLWMKFLRRRRRRLSFFHSSDEAHTWIVIVSITAKSAVVDRVRRLGNSQSRLRALVKCEWLIGTANTRAQRLCVCECAQAIDHYYGRTPWQSTKSLPTPETATSETRTRLLSKRVHRCAHHIHECYCDRMQIDDLFSFHVHFVRTELTKTTAPVVVVVDGFQFNFIHFLG